MPKILKSKTIIFALLLAIFGAVEASMGTFSTYMTPEVFGFFSMGIGIVVAILRVLTTLPISEK